MNTDTDQIENDRIDSDEIVHLGSTPGAQYGWECAGCQGRSGLAYGHPGEAARGLANHQASGHE